MAKAQSDFIKVTIYGQNQEGGELEKAGTVLINKNRIVSALFSIGNATLILETTTIITTGSNQHTMVPKLAVQKGKIVRTSESAYKEGEVWQVNAEPATLQITDKAEILAVWDTIFPGDTFTGFDEHEALAAKMAALREQKEKEAKEAAEREALGLVTADGQPLTEENIGQAPILDMNGNVAESNQ